MYTHRVWYPLFCFWLEGIFRCHVVVFLPCDGIVFAICDVCCLLIYENYATLLALKLIKTFYLIYCYDLHKTLNICIHFVLHFRHIPRSLLSLYLSVDSKQLFRSCIFDCLVMLAFSISAKSKYKLILSAKFIFKRFCFPLRIVASYLYTFVCFSQLHKLICFKSLLRVNVFWNSYLSYLLKLLQQLLIVSHVEMLWKRKYTRLIM